MNYARMVSNIVLGAVGLRQGVARGLVTVLTAGVATACLFTSPTEAALLVFDAANDFSATNNPNGPWSYGYKTGNGAGAFTPFTIKFTQQGVDFWAFPSPPPFGALPQVAHNPTASTEIFSTAIVGPGEMTFHPGEQGELAVVRFTAPITTTYSVSSFFQDRDTAANSADVSIVRGASQLFFQSIGGSATFTQSLALGAGDTVDFQLGAGANSFFNDNKLISVHITAVPEPHSAIFVVGGMALLLGIRRRRKH